MWRDYPTPNPIPIKAAPPGWRIGHSGSLQTSLCQKTASLGSCLSLPFPFYPSARPRRGENRASHLVHECTHTLWMENAIQSTVKHRGFSFSGRPQYLAPRKFTPDYGNSWRGALHCCPTHLLQTEHNFTLKLCKAITQHNTKLPWPDVFPLFFRRRSPIAKETRCPSRSPGPCGAVRRQVGAGGSREGSGAGAARGERAAHSAGGCFWWPLFRAEVLCPQAKLNWRMFFMSKRDAGSHPECLLDNNNNNISLAGRVDTAYNMLHEGIMPRHNEEKQ